ncbi:MAG: hypothetical protein Q4C96_05390 [Planctomycetia bacterium]|nr:hypothetical protein [Planctomycetia bacterium]
MTNNIMLVLLLNFLLCTSSERRHLRQNKNPCLSADAGSGIYALPRG